MRAGHMATPTLQQLLEGKRFGLVLSAGFFGFYGHTGFLKGLLGSGLTPSAYAGTSAGGMVAAFAAAGSPIGDIEELVLRQTRQNFWDPDPIGAIAQGGHGFTGLLKGARFRSLLQSSLPVQRFEDLPTPLLLCATNLSSGTTDVFTKGELVPRIHATCAYPGLFRAVPLDGKLYWDGGLVDKAPAVPLADSEFGDALDALVVHYLPSRTSQTLGGPFAYMRGISASMAAVRRDHFKLQLRVLEARKLPVYVVVSTLPPVTPSTMERGFDALDQAKLSAQKALARAPVPFDQLP